MNRRTMCHVEADRPYRVCVDEDGTAFRRRDRNFATWASAMEYAESILTPFIGSALKVRVLRRSLKTEGYSYHATWNGMVWAFSEAYLNSGISAKS